MKSTWVVRRHRRCPCDITPCIAASTPKSYYPSAVLTSHPVRGETKCHILYKPSHKDCHRLILQKLKSRNRLSKLRIKNNISISSLPQQLHPLQPVAVTAVLNRCCNAACCNHKHQNINVCSYYGNDTQRF